MSEKKVYVLGGFQTDFARNWAKENKHIVALMREAYEGGIAETKIEAEDIEAAFVGNFAAELYSTQGHLGAFMIDFDPHFYGLPTLRCEAACASSGISALSAVAFLQAGIYDLICVMGVEQMKTVDSKTGGDFLGTAAWYEKEAKGVEFPFAKLFGDLGTEYDKRFGLDSKYLSMISAKNYENAKKNPNAQTRNWFMSYEHANAVTSYNSIVSGCIKVSDCSQITDGAVTVFLASEKYAAKYAKSHNMDLDRIPAVLGWGHTTAPLLFSEKISKSKSDPFVLPLTRKAIEDAFKRAKIQNCWDLDAVETHDCFTTTEYMAIDHFGLTEPGKSWRAIEEGVVNLGGKLPFNSSGGLIGGGHPVGATGARQILDAYKQVTNTAGAYQVEGAKKAATLNIGGTATTNVCFILGF